MLDSKHNQPSLQKQDHHHCDCKQRGQGSAARGALRTKSQSFFEEVKSQSRGLRSSRVAQGFIFDGAVHYDAVHYDTLHIADLGRYRKSGQHAA